MKKYIKISKFSATNCDSLLRGDFIKTYGLNTCHLVGIADIAL